jgi:gas vesicle protein
MNRATGTFIKGIATGMAVGTAMGMLGDPLRSGKQRMDGKKKAAKALKAVGELVENVQYMMK